MPECDHVRQEFSALLDGELDPETRDTVEAHLHHCSECLRKLDSIKKVSDHYARLGRVSAPPDFEERLAEALRPKRLSGFRSYRSFGSAAALMAAAMLLLIVSLQRGVFSPEPGEERVLLSKAEVNAPAPRRADTNEAEAERLKDAPEASAPLTLEAAAPEPPDEKLMESTETSDPMDAMDAMDQTKSTESIEPIQSIAPPPPPPPARAPVESVVHPEPEPKPKSAPTPASPAPEALEALGYLEEAQPQPAAGAPVELQQEFIEERESLDDAPQNTSISEELASPAVEMALPSGAARDTEGAPAMEDALIAKALRSPGVALGRAVPTPTARKSQAMEFGGIAATGVAEAATSRVVAGSEFNRDAAGLWIQQGYRGASAGELVRGSRAFNRLAKKFVGLKEIAELSGTVLFQFEGTWYRLVSRQ